MDGNFAKLLITIATLKQENDRLTMLVEKKGENYENSENQRRNSRKSSNIDAQT